jgi:hypothetical protein
MPLLRKLTPRRRLGLLILTTSLLIALVSAVASVSTISLLPPKVQKRNLQTAGAVTHAMVDLDRSGITDRNAEWAYFNRMTDRADVLAHLMASPSALEYVGRRAHVPADEIAAIAPVTLQVAGPLTEPGSEMRARQIEAATKPYRLEIQSKQGSQIVDVYAQAPSIAQAEALADASVAGARDYFRAIAAHTKLPPSPLGFNARGSIRVVQLGPARGAVLTSRTGLKVAALAFLLAFSVASVALWTLVAIARRRGRVPKASAAEKPSGNGSATVSRRTVTAATARGGMLPWSVQALEPGGGALALRPPWPVFARARITVGDGNWPRTTRVLPWMLAALIAMLWLVPFDSIQLRVSFPIDLKLDRLVLPFIVVLWVFALAIGGRAGARLRMTWIHAAVGGFVAVAFLSVILDATALSQALELDTALKKLPLLLSYLSVFLMMASAVRREEVAAFVKYTLVLAVICALGMVWEDKLGHNLFFEWSQRVLPGVFRVTVEGSGFDSAGRRLVHGPAAHPLVAAGMLSMAVPIAVLGVVQARRTTGRILYGLATCVLMLGVLSTQRKTGLVAPFAGVLTLAYFRRRELLRLTPLAVLLVIALITVSPGTATPVVNQFKPDNLHGAGTVSDRASDYDAIRPDVWSHVAIGQGYGGYEPLGHRILDSEVLGIIVEMGVLGLVAFLLLGVSVVATARATIQARHPPWAPSALAGAAAAVVFLVLATLFDSLAYPQLPYIFLCFAALVAVIVKSPDDDDGTGAGA